ncbi:uncharacterized protein TM35_000231350 [Trypanosoma theileri]|uniref:sn-1-specific diacylglycerol lipase n=1 Tax=Trypanosoma theileri TaxID=67003 RepID=A0A1X0NR43_9TRYP|nr:uncharacterized protein TM35_000231350 [Trypanosoma theileri]ORC87164.1 hypothetical protein TM35_000231350 [Trypanosoma theileri]
MNSSRSIEAEPNSYSTISNDTKRMDVDTSARSRSKEVNSMLPEVGANLWGSFKDFIRQQQLNLTVDHSTSNANNNNNKEKNRIPSFTQWNFPFSLTNDTKTTPPVFSGLHHRHCIMSTTFYYPTKCSQCLSVSKVKETGNSENKETDHTEEDNTNREKTKLLGIPSNTLLGFGSPGYCCVTCNFTLHPVCFQALDPTSYDLLTTTITTTTEEKESINEKPVPEESDLPSAVRFLSVYVFKDPKAANILCEFMGLLQRFSNRHPSIGRCLLNPYNIASINKRHEELYKLCCDALVDANFVQVEGVNGPTMQFIRYTMRFAAAVYGLPYQKGFLSSAFWGVLLRGVRRDLLTASEEANNAAVAATLDLPDESVKLSRWSHYAEEPSYCILVDHLTRRIVWAFRGTLSDGDVLSDVCAYGVPFCGCYAHAGAVRMLSAMFDNRAVETSDVVFSPNNERNDHHNSDGNNDSNLQNEVSHTNDKDDSKNTDRSKKNPNADRGINVTLELLQRYPEYAFIVTGHSLGGGVALLFGVRAIKEQVFGEEGTRRLRVIAFAPMPVLTMPATESYEGQIWSIVSGCDAVCRLQLNSIDRLAAQITHDDTPTSDIVTEETMKDEKKEKNSSSRRSSNAAFSFLSSSFDHLSAYVKSKTLKTNNNIRSSDAEDITEEMHHPGRVFMLTTPWKLETNRIVEVPRGNIVMHHLFISQNMFREHIMDRYLTSLAEVHLSNE